MIAESNQLQIETTATADGTIVVTVRGEADIDSAPVLRAAITAVADQNPAAVTLDLAGLDFIDSCGTSVLVEAQLRASREGWKLTLRNLAPQAARVLGVAGLAAKFTITPPVPTRLSQHPRRLRTPSFG